VKGEERSSKKSGLGKLARYGRKYDDQYRYGISHFEKRDSPSFLFYQHFGIPLRRKYIERSVSTLLF
jgi:hypothetical protein